MGEHKGKNLLKDFNPYWENLPKGDEELFPFITQNRGCGQREEHCRYSIADRYRERYAHECRYPNSIIDSSWRRYRRGCDEVDNAKKGHEDGESTHLDS